MRNQHGSLNINFNYLGSRLYLKTPKMRAPFGIGRGMNDSGFNIQFSFDRDNEEAQVFLKKCEEFDRTMIEAGIQNAFDWGITTKKTAVPSREVVEEKYKSMVKYPKFGKTHPNAGEVNPEWPPYIQVQLPQTQPKPGDEGAESVPQFTTELYDASKNMIPLSEETLTKQSRCTALIYGSGYSSNAGFGVSWKAAQLLLLHRTGIPKNHCLIDDPEEDDDSSHFPDAQAVAEEAQVTSAPVQMSSSAPASSSTPAQPASPAPATEATEEAEEVEATAVAPEPVKLTPAKKVAPKAVKKA